MTYAVASLSTKNIYYGVTEEVYNSTLDETDLIFCEEHKSPHLTRMRISAKLSVATGKKVFIKVRPFIADSWYHLNN